MADQISEFQVSAGELEYLRQLASRDGSLAGPLCVHEAGSGGGATLRLSREAAKQLRDRLMDEMDLVGFDENYLPNEQGLIIEALIDCLFLR